MLCLDMKLVSRLRGLSTNSSAGGANSNAGTGTLSISSHSGEKQRRRSSRGSNSNASPSVSDRESDEDIPSVPRIVRDRSRSVCMPVLTSSQMRHLHRRASHHVSSTDTTSRRGVLSRRCYGSVEMLPQIEQDGMENGRRFRVENGDSPGEKEEMFGSPSTPVLENPEYQTRWYFKYFLGKLHQNYVASDHERNPLFLSVVLSDGGDQCVPHYRVILWRRTGAQKISLPYSSNKSMTVKQILSNFFGIEKFDKAPREIFSPEIQKDLLLLEEQEGSVNFKFGVIYAREGQTTDDEMLSNERASPGFERFLEILGERIRLKGWDKYRGGLDIKGDMTGKESVYTVYAGHEVMYHVSTILPHSKDNPQQLERKRHIGNDIVNIIYSDDPSVLETFNPNCIRSQFTHVFAVVTSEENDRWRIAIYCDESVPLFGPSLPCPPVFDDPYIFREFLLVKLINGEKATFDTPTFSRKRERTLDALLRDLYQEHTQDAKGNSMLNRRALSDVVETPGRRREETRVVEMVRVGQALKLEAIVRGLAPTSLATVGPLKPRPWEPRCIYPDFSHEVVCGDIWSENKLVLATENGTFLVEDGMENKMLFDRTVLIKQLDVVEQHGILLFRAGDKGKECGVHVYRLSELDGDEAHTIDDYSFEEDDEELDSFGTHASTPRPQITRTRSHVKERKLERTRGCHLYSLTRPGGSHLRMCVAVGRRLTLLQWKHNAAWTTWCSAADTDTVDGFLLIKEYNASEPPNIVTIIESTEGGNEWLLCCGLRHHFELISVDGATRSLHVEASMKPHIIAALDLREDEEPEVLLCYNNTCHFQKLSEESAASTEFDFNWNSVPIAVACAFPYVIAFTADTMEIRLIINGNLVHTIAMPNLTLISSKRDIYFATTAPEFLAKCERIRVDTKDKEDRSGSPPSSQSSLSNSQNDGKPLRIYTIPLHTLSRPTSKTSNRGRCTSPVEPEIVNAQPQCDPNFLSVEPHRLLSRSCSSSPTPNLGASSASTPSK
ncbi:GTPase-activating Rap/Ran-GAP domain-like protein 3 isoform X2 [Diachasma alloeum]|uniref:GTPase-activating Rap/Ran-GAP domain-like protein 3 isoform X2 n=1 Tax=Diachasma alloeum TaxID=454923 RepID=UPI000738212F|nr:GTPase-activating Rap/Ran-GAP domain-like protein 3 isoform X2 [Diachasma alloeum]